MFSSEKGDPSVVGYVDSDDIGDVDDNGSTIGYVLLLQEDLFVGNRKYNL
jgi:hypothetical protein